MRATLSLAALGLAATALAAEPRTWGQLMHGLPSCERSCLSRFYYNNVASQCGQSAKSSSSENDLYCICTTASGVDSDVLTDLTTCIASACADATAEDVNKASATVDDLYDLCLDHFDTSDTSGGNSGDQTNHNAAPGLSIHVPAVVGAVGVLGAILA